jgi:hypothetical protein
MTETPAPYYYTPGQHRHTAILRRLTRIGWQAQRMGMEVREVDPARAPAAALQALDDLIEAATCARAAIAREADA